MSSVVMGNCCLAPSFMVSGEDRPTSNTPLLLEKRQSNDAIVAAPTTNRSVVANESSEPRLVSFKPVNVPRVDKQLQDHASLYNDHVQRYVSLREVMRELVDMSPGSRDSQQRTLINTFTKIKCLCDEADAVVAVRRTHAYCLHLSYDSDLVLASVLPVLIAFNRANELVRKLMDKAPPLVMAADLLIRDEKDLRHDVLAANLGTDGPICMQHCLSNIAELRRVPGWVRDITTNTVQLFERLKTVACVFDGAES